MVNIAADYSSLAVKGKENMGVYSPKSPTPEEPDKVRGSQELCIDSGSGFGVDFDFDFDYMCRI